MSYSRQICLILILSFLYPTQILQLHAQTTEANTTTTATADGQQKPEDIIYQNMISSGEESKKTVRKLITYAQLNAGLGIPLALACQKGFTEPFADILIYLGGSMVFFLWLMDLNNKEKKSGQEMKAQIAASPDINQTGATEKVIELQKESLRQMKKRQRLLEVMAWLPTAAFAALGIQVAIYAAAEATGGSKRTTDLNCMDKPQPTGGSGGGGGGGDPFGAISNVTTVLSLFNMILGTFGANYKKIEDQIELEKAYAFNFKQLLKPLDKFTETGHYTLAFYEKILDKNEIERKKEFELLSLFFPKARAQAAVYDATAVKVMTETEKATPTKIHRTAGDWWKLIKYYITTWVGRLVIYGGISIWNQIALKRIYPDLAEYEKKLNEYELDFLERKAASLDKKYKDAFASKKMTITPIEVGEMRRENSFGCMTLVDNVPQFDENCACAKTNTCARLADKLPPNVDVEVTNFMKESDKFLTGDPNAKLPSAEDNKKLNDHFQKEMDKSLSVLSSDPSKFGLGKLDLKSEMGKASDQLNGLMGGKQYAVVDHVADTSTKSNSTNSNAADYEFSMPGFQVAQNEGARGGVHLRDEGAPISVPLNDIDTSDNASVFSNISTRYQKKYQSLRKK